MSKINATNNISYYTNDIKGNQSAPQYYVSYTGGLDSDVYEGSKSKTKKVITGLIGIATLAAGALWLWKGKGWDKLKNLFKHSTPKTEGPKPKTKANETLKDGKKKVSQEVSHEVAIEKVQNSINRPAYVNENPDIVMRNIETVNADNASCRLADRAKSDTVTPDELLAYSRLNAYKAPTKKQAEIIAQVNKEAAEKSAQARQIGNLIPESQVQAVKAAGESAVSGIKKGTYKSKDGYTLTYGKEGSIEKIVTPDGRTITKPKSIYNYEQKIDFADLKEV